MRITRLHTVLALLLLFAIVVIVIAPSVDLDPTTLRAQQMAMMAMAAIAAAGMGFTDVPAPRLDRHARFFCVAPLPALSGRLDLLCTWLC